ncbi:aldehyde dehydrogenase family protein, partial [Candidatus Sumerlaeota bacterium]|nr:aldehyde dehydrogenase family protein [Candidatus Sumerlaeota bacterium]
ATPAQMERAIAGADRAFKPLSELPAYERAGMLMRVAEGLRARRREMADLLVGEAGKPITYALVEVDRAIDTFTIASEEAKRQGGELLPLEISPPGKGHWGIVRRFPIGPVAGISPYNFPLNLVAHKVAPALACGNPIVLRPATQTPLASLLLAEICCDAGVPAGVFSVLPCSREVATPLTDDPRLKKLTFTGSVPVGWMLKARANTKRVTLELGSNAACVIDADADLDAVIPRVAIGAFYNAGQSCISIQRIYAHRKIFREFERRLVRHVRTKIRAGDPRRPETVVGPLIDAANATRVVEWLREAEAQGAKILCGGKRRGNVVTPAVVTRVKPTMKISCEEVFGPVVTLEPWSDFGDVLDRVNDSVYGLQAGIFTSDVRKIARAFRELNVGGVVINNTPTYRIDSMPYGGEKDSGLGREGVRWAIEEMTATKILVVNTV